MICIQAITIGRIPALEIKLDAKDKKEPHYIVAYHGWTKSKDEDILMGIELVKKGFHLILPDAPHHGQYKDDRENIDPYDFPKILLQAVEDFKDIYEYIREKGESKPHVSVCGISMGGIISSLLLAKYPYIQAAGILMGTSHPYSFIIDLIHQQSEAEKLMTHPQIIKLLDRIKDLDLSMNLNVLGKRKVFIWHAKNDAIVPVKYHAHFINFLNSLDNPYAYKILIDENSGHKVPFSIFSQLGEFLI